MSKVFRLLILILLYFFILPFVNAVDNDDINIISRLEWWAPEWFRYLDSEVWQEKLLQWKNTPKKESDHSQNNIAKIEAEKLKKANHYINNNYSNIFWIKNIIREENGHKLAWPNSYSKKKVAIIIHHTDSDIKKWDDNYEVVRNIYKYHSLTKWWWDIGYNFLIWTSGEIFEGRAWWDYIVWAHDKWNNQATIWISLIWNYDNQKASKEQMESLKKLTEYLVKKYNINLNRKVPFFKWCNWISEKCQEKPLTISYEYPIIWHKDAWHTRCPGDKLYAQLQLMKTQLWVWISLKDKKILDKIETKLRNVNEYKLLKLLSKIELLLDNDNIKNKNLLLWVKDLILSIEFEKDIYSSIPSSSESFDLNNKIKIKLSYPISDSISIKVNKDLSLDFIKSSDEYILDFKKLGKSFKNNNSFKFDLIKNKLFIKGVLIIDFNKTKFLRIKVPKGNIIEINSWNRKPKWDKSLVLNDNKFRWDIVLYTKNNELVVVNDIFLNDYLKWLWEISNWTNKEKIRTIIILARTYARWYTTKARKFAWEWYDGSDDPNVFQKYLWFWLEQRSSNVNEIVEETKDLVVTYNWDLIKPWYFSSSDWKTTSFIDFCKYAKWVPDCSNPEKFPFLIWAIDNWWVWKKRAWHWVWVPWTWVQYFSDRKWSFFMIIKYFLKWVEVEKI